jgi:hypothetical protein
VKKQSRFGAHGNRRRALNAEMGGFFAQVLPAGYVRTRRRVARFNAAAG